MERYVDADELRAGVYATNWYHIRDGRLVRGARSDLDPLYKAADIVELVDSLEPADVAPVVHAHWIDYLPETQDVRMICSNCATVDAPMYKWKFCPNCGARMDEEVEE